MICYRDTTYCGSDVEVHTCGREFTEQDAINAEKWWGSKDYPVAYGKFCEEAEMGDSLEEILERYRLHANMAYSEVEDNFRTAEEFKTLALPKVLDGAKQALLDWHNKQIAKAREQAIEDVKYAGYGYDDGTGFVLKISYAELATLKEHKEAK